MDIKKYLTNALLSTEENNYRPYVLRPTGILLLCVLLIGIKLSLSSGVLMQTQLVQVQKEITSENIFKLTNDKRVENSLKGLTYSTLLEEAAMKKAQHMMDNDYWAHESPDGVTPWHWFASVGYDYEQAGENLAVDFITADGVMNGWMNSPTHRANILEKEYTEIGVGILEGEFQGKISTIVVQLFGRPKVQLASNTVPTNVTVTPVASKDTTPPVTSVSPEPGNYDKSVTVYLASNEPSYIYYKLGTELPSTRDKKYDSPFVLSESSYLSFFAIDMDGNAENIQRVYYDIGNKPSQRTQDNDTSTNTVTITSPRNREIINNGMVTITGNATPNSTIDLYINDAKVRSKKVNVSGKFQMKETLLQEGKNELKVMAGTAESKVFVILDKEKPTFTISENHEVNEYDTYYTVNLDVTTESTDIISIIANNENDVELDTLDNSHYMGIVTIPKDTNNNSIIVRATDIAGNHVEKTLEVDLSGAVAGTNNDTSATENDANGTMATTGTDDSSQSTINTDDIITGETANNLNAFTSNSRGLGMYKWVITGVLVFLIVVIGVNNYRNREYNVPSHIHHTSMLLSFLTLLTIGLIIFL